MAVYSVWHRLSAKVKAKLVYLSEQSLFGDMVTVYRQWQLSQLTIVTSTLRSWLRGS